jgi:hypothetical protein
VDDTVIEDLYKNMFPKKNNKKQKRCLTVDASKKALRTKSSHTKRVYQKKQNKKLSRDKNKDRKEHEKKKKKKNLTTTTKQLHSGHTPETF